MRPAVLVTEGERHQAVLLHLLGERPVLVKGLGDVISLVPEHALPVEDGPRIVVVRHQILLAVQARRLFLQRIGESVEVPPKIADVGEQSLLREVLHTVAREPHEDIVRGALEIAVDVLLEVLVVDGIDPHRLLGLLLVRLEGLGEGLLRHGVRGVGAHRDAAGAAAAGGEQGREGHGARADRRAPQQRPAGHPMSCRSLMCTRAAER